VFERPLWRDVVGDSRRALRLLRFAADGSYRMAGGEVTTEARSSRSETNLFAMKAGFSVHIKLCADDLPFEAKADGSPEWPVNTLLRGTDTVIAWLSSHGFEHDPSKDRPNFGNRQAKPEMPAPSDIPVPKHCGVDMKYKQAAGKGVYECRKGAECVNARDVNGRKYGASVWEDNWRKESSA
jgi:hypothetical protein